MTTGKGRPLDLAAIALTLTLAYGIWMSYSLVLVALLKEFGWSRSVLGGAFSVLTIVHGATGPVAGALCARMQPRTLIAWGSVALGLSLVASSFIATPLHLYLTLGTFTAAALSCCGWIPNLVQVQRDFRDRLGLAMGIASAGVALAGVVIVPVLQGLMDAYGWRVALRVLGVACVLWIVPASLLMERRARRRAAARPGPSSNGGNPHAAVSAPGPATADADAGVTAKAAATAAASATVAPEPAAALPAAAPAPTASLTLREAIRGQTLWLIVALYFLGNFATQTISTHQAAFFVDRGMPALAAASIISIVGIASIASKISCGWLSDRFDRELVYIVGISGLVVAIAVLGVYDRLPREWVSLTYAVVFGAGYAVTSSVLPAMIGDRFSGANFGTIIGFSMSLGSFGSALGAWLGGHLFDVTGSYAIPFALAGLGAFASAMAAWRARTVRTLIAAGAVPGSPRPAA